MTEQKLKWKWYTGGEEAYKSAMKKWKTKVAITSLAVVISGIALFFQWRAHGLGLFGL